MYLTLARSDPGARRPGARSVSPAVDSNVKALGAVSLVTDISSEMVAAILPIYLLVGLGLSPFTVGLVGGFYSGATVALRLVGARLADRTRRLKLIAGAGYGVSAAAKLLLVAGGGSLGPIGVAIGADRLGKGLRTAPRDALISLSSEPATLGRAFGLHRAMDSVGALAGPLVAFVILWRLPGRYDAVFVVSLCIAVFGVVLLALFVRDHRRAAAVPSGPTWTALATLARRRGLRRVWVNACLLGLATIGDGFVYLVLQRRLDASVSMFALLPLGTAAVFLVLATPFGRLADRIGRWRLFLGGHLALVAVYLLLWSGLQGKFLLVAVLGAHGAYYAATDGVLMAIASPLVPAEHRASGLALVQTGSAAMMAAGAGAFGAGWSLLGPSTTLLVFAALLLVLVAVAAAFRPQPAHEAV